MDLKRTRFLVTVIIVTVAAGSTLAVRTVSARSSTPAPARQTSGDHTITVTGHGDARVSPDQATLTLGVETRGADAQEALSKNSAKMNAVIAAVEAQGVPANHIQTSGVSIWYDKQDNAYTVSHHVTVVIYSVNKVGAVLDAAVAAGANNTWGVNFGLQDPSTGQADALRAAIARARKHADAMASSLAVTISGVRSASEPTYESRPITYGPVASASGAPSGVTPVQAGELTVTADVTVVYTFS